MEAKPFTRASSPLSRLPSAGQVLALAVLDFSNLARVRLHEQPVYQKVPHCATCIDCVSVPHGNSASTRIPFFVRFVLFWGRGRNLGSMYYNIIMSIQVCL